MIQPIIGKFYKVKGKNYQDITYKAVSKNDAEKFGGFLLNYGCNTIFMVRYNKNGSYGGGYYAFFDMERYPELQIDREVNEDGSEIVADPAPAIYGVYKVGGDSVSFPCISLEDTYEKAKTYAETLAKRYPGEEYVVTKPAMSFKVETQPVAIKEF